MGACEVLITPAFWLGATVGHLHVRPSKFDRRRGTSSIADDRFTTKPSDGALANVSSQFWQVPHGAVPMLLWYHGSSINTVHS